MYNLVNYIFVGILLNLVCLRLKFKSLRLKFKSLRLKFKSLSPERSEEFNGLNFSLKQTKLNPGKNILSHII